MQFSWRLQYVCRQMQISQVPGLSQRTCDAHTLLQLLVLLFQYSTLLTYGSLFGRGACHALLKPPVQPVCSALKAV